ncbi:hypothetical protein K474DRAFT_1730135 [Panus rudis PR-1116 ss-1]|nr:hypothetical protein K474DRAFT_1730135 [Panus rudis PR-1116 ss-1]
MDAAEMAATCTTVSGMIDLNDQSSDGGSPHKESLQRGWKKLCSGGFSLCYHYQHLGPDASGALFKELKASSIRITDRGLELHQQVEHWENRGFLARIMMTGPGPELKEECAKFEERASMWNILVTQCGRTAQVKHIEDVTKVQQQGFLD